MEKRRYSLTERTTEEAAARRAAMHQIYSYLLRLAAQKRAADRGEFGHLTRPAEIDTPAMEPKVQHQFTTGHLLAQVPDNGATDGQPTAHGHGDNAAAALDAQEMLLRAR
jgi:hypothetical protein